MTRGRGWLAAGVVFLVGAAAVVWWTRPPRQEPAAAAVERPSDAAGAVKFLMEQQWAIRMKLAQAEPRAIARQITAVGRVVPAAGRHAVVAPPVGGIIAGAMPRLGQAVTRGQAIALLRQTLTAAETSQMAASDAQLRIEHTRLEAERRRLAEAVTEAQVRARHARTEVERAQRLFAAKAYSQRQVETAETESRAADSILAAAMAQREALQAVAAPPSGAAATFTVHAPIAGVVVKVSKTSGEQVASGEAMMEIVDAETVWVEVPMFERDLHRIARGTRATFSLPAAPDTEFTGRVVDLGAVINPQTRAATLVFEVPNTSRALRIGIQVNARLDAGETVQALMVPRESVLEAEGKRIVYVLLSGEEFQRREIVVGDEYGDRVAVLSGLKAGERVVTQGAYQLRQHELRPSTPGAHTHET
jgi:cobalt-zinc-cadmium efflux system membrane fusion protein